MVTLLVMVGEGVREEKFSSSGGLWMFAVSTLDLLGSGDVLDGFRELCYDVRGCGWHAAPNIEYKRCSSCIPGLEALTGYYQPVQLNPGQPKSAPNTLNIFTQHLETENTSFMEKLSGLNNIRINNSRPDQVNAHTLKIFTQHLETENTSFMANLSSLNDIRINISRPG
ncbi:hypothetical protein LAZ67_3004243 [Cordylochernes scorpioides]|uniref:Uncharacterized protein n=1 Tax=Cordylochernes scorpioides TaxID=51811 RepID=A0ABY6K9G4_9ARAC|nr:hypothetical protein LAZ67_3004243 [Cordylochernes scorpioides]